LLKIKTLRGGQKQEEDNPLKKKAMKFVSMITMKNEVREKDVLSLMRHYFFN